MTPGLTRTSGCVGAMDDVLFTGQCDYPRDRTTTITTSAFFIIEPPVCASLFAGQRGSPAESVDPCVRVPRHRDKIAVELPIIQLQPRCSRRAGDAAVGTRAGIHRPLS